MDAKNRCLRPIVAPALTRRHVVAALGATALGYGAAARDADQGVVSPAMAPPAAAASQATPVPCMGDCWVTYAIWRNESAEPITSLRSTWKVPHGPTALGGEQIVYLFNGLREYGGEGKILQPVLQWGQSPLAGGNYWSVASWCITNAGTRGPLCYSRYVTVETDDTLTGVITLTGQDESGYEYSCEFEGLPETRLTITGAPLLSLAVHVLEAFGVSDCAEYPDTNVTRFEEIDLKIGTLQPSLIPWHKRDVIKDCGQHTVVVDTANPGGIIELFYR